MVDWHETALVPVVPVRPRRRKYHSTQRQERVQLLRYGCGMWLGVVAVHVTKKIIRSIPVVGVLAKPVLNLFPTMLVGPAVGAAVVFALDEGDVDTATRKVKKAVKNASREVNRAASSVTNEFKSLVDQQDRSQSLMPPVVDEGLEAIDKRLGHALEREYQKLQRSLEDFRRNSGDIRAQLQEAAAGRS